MNLLGPSTQTARDGEGPILSVGGRRLGAGTVVRNSQDLHELAGTDLEDKLALLSNPAPRSQAPEFNANF